ncbi:MAG: TetR/AcrR family transcriptional regulator [Micropruina sp.]|nr:MAG: TetR/AcrR family transcriptional regulator [Micropruina sp.]
MELTARQAQLADVGLRLVAREGMASVTFRAIASESGWSLGAVQKAFPSKEAILRAMFARLRTTSVALPPDEPGRPTLRAWLAELLLRLLPLDEPRRTALLKGSAFAERAAYDAELAAAIAASDAELRRLLGALVRRAQAEGELDEALEPDLVARAFLALATGLATQCLYEPLDEAAARRLAQDAVARLTSPIV